MSTMKKAICMLVSGAALGIAPPAFADPGHGWDRGRGHAYGHYDRGG